MTQIAQMQGERVTKTRHARALSRQSRVNDILALFLFLAAGLVPLALGANNPIAWSLNAGLVGLTALVYLSTLTLINESPRVGLSRYGLEAGLLIVLIGFLIVQTLPLSVLGFSPSVVDVEGNHHRLNQISLTPDATGLMALRLASYGLFFYLALQVAANRDRALRLAQAMLFVFAGHALYGLLALAFLGDGALIYEKWAYKGVATGAFVNRNSFATFLAIGLVLGVALTLRSLVKNRSETGQRLPRQDEQFAQSAILGVASIIILAALMATQSRMGLFAGLVGVALVIFLAGIKLKSHKSRTLLLGLGGAALVFMLVLLAFGAGTLERLGSVESSADVRLDLYAQIWGMIKEHWLWGTGGGSFEIAYTLHHRWPVSPDLVWDRAHNTYLALWSEVGVIAGSVPIVIFALLTLRVIFLIIARRQDWWLPVVSLASIVVIAIHSLVDFSMEIQGVVFAFLLVVALGLDTRGGGDRSRTDRSGHQKDTQLQ